MAGFDDRGVSEGASIAALVLLTVIVTGSVGLGVLIADSGSEEGPEAEFTFSYFPERQAMLVTYDDGDQLQATDVVISGANDVTWAELSGANETATISPGDRVQLNENNAYGEEITDNTNVTVFYGQGDNRTVLGSWEGG